MELKSKPKWQSKTLWITATGFAAAVLEILAHDKNIPVNLAPYILLALCISLAINRVLSEPTKLK